MSLTEKRRSAFASSALAAIASVAASATTACAPQAPAREPRRPDGILYDGALGAGLGGSRQPGTTTVTPGFAALGSLTVGLSAYDWAIIGIRVDASYTAGDAVGDVGLHLAVFPGANGVGPVRDFQIFGDACVGGPLSDGSSGGNGGAFGLGRIGVAWERYRAGFVTIGPFLAGQFARSSSDSQEALLAGISFGFSNERKEKRSPPAAPATPPPPPPPSTAPLLPPPPSAAAAPR